MFFFKQTISYLNDDASMNLDSNNIDNIRIFLKFVEYTLVRMLVFHEKRFDNLCQTCIRSDD